MSALSSSGPLACSSEQNGLAGAPPRQSPRVRSGAGDPQPGTFQIATLIYDATVVFCHRFIDDHACTTDQLVRAARVGRQNIGEGSRAPSAANQTKIRLFGVARASLDELLFDYEDFLRQRGLPLWDQNGPQARRVRELAHAPQPDPQALADPTGLASIFGPHTPWLNHQDPAIVANTIVCLIHQVNDLLKQQLGVLERDFAQEGGSAERLAAARIAERERERSAPKSIDREKREHVVPDCPTCGAPMVLRTARRGKTPGAQFWGCTSYPDCRGTRAQGFSKDLTDHPTDRWPRNL
jgi:restriction system protein